MVGRGLAIGGLQITFTDLVIYCFLHDAYIAVILTCFYAHFSYVFYIFVSPLLYCSDSFYIIGYLRYLTTTMHWYMFWYRYTSLRRLIDRPCLLLSSLLCTRLPSLSLCVHMNMCGDDRTLSIMSEKECFICSSQNDIEFCAFSKIVTGEQDSFARCTGTGCLTNCRKEQWL